MRGAMSREKPKLVLGKCSSREKRGSENPAEFYRIWDRAGCYLGGLGRVSVSTAKTAVSRTVAAGAPGSYISPNDTPSFHPTHTQPPNQTLHRQTAGWAGQTVNPLDP